MPDRAGRWPLVAAALGGLLAAACLGQFGKAPRATGGFLISYAAAFLPYAWAVRLAFRPGAQVPFALVFATPKFCKSAQCGPTLERVKAVAAQRPGFTVVNVEPYQLDFVDGALQARLDADGQLQAVPASDAYGLVTEPWVFVIDGGGTITTSLEGVFADEELLAAIDAVG